jgi:hypothetical protein
LSEVVHSLKNEKSACLFDISSYCLEEYVPYMLKPLLKLVKASLREGIFLSTLKKLVKSIYKKGMKQDANNYCPITLVPDLSQILKKSNTKSPDLFCKQTGHT